MKYPRTILLEWVEQCLDQGCLTKWEESFMVSVSDQLERGRDLSERQEEILERIYAERTS